MGARSPGAGRTIHAPRSGSDTTPVPVRRTPRAPLPGTRRTGCHDRRVTRRALLSASTALAVSLLLTGCGDEAGPAASTSSSPAAEQGGEDAAEPTDGAGGTGGDTGSDTGSDTGGDGGGAAPSSFPGDTSPDTAEASADARVTVSDIRTGRHQGFDRVVFEAGGTGTPGWDVRYVDAPSSQGSGEPVDVAGDAVLQVTLTGAGYPYDTGVEEFAGPDPLPGQGTANVTEVVFDATFEGTTVAFVGTRAEAPFRVYLLQDPVRVVVEVADAA
jgi:hypothetical protein